MQTVELPSFSILHLLQLHSGHGDKKMLILSLSVPMRCVERGFCMSAIIFCSLGVVKMFQCSNFKKYDFTKENRIKCYNKITLNYILGHQCKVVENVNTHYAADEDAEAYEFLSVKLFLCFQKVVLPWLCWRRALKQLRRAVSTFKDCSRPTPDSPHGLPVKRTGSML